MRIADEKVCHTRFGPLSDCFVAEGSGKTTSDHYEGSREGCSINKMLAKVA